MSMVINVNLKFLKLICFIQNKVDSTCFSDFKDIYSVFYSETLTINLFTRLLHYPVEESLAMTKIRAALMLTVMMT